MARHISFHSLFLALCCLCASFMDVCQGANALKKELLPTDNSNLEHKVGRLLGTAFKKLGNAISTENFIWIFEDRMKVCTGSISSPFYSHTFEALTLIYYSASADYALFYQTLCMGYLLWYTGSFSWIRFIQTGRHSWSQEVTRKSSGDTGYFFFLKLILAILALPISVPLFLVLAVSSTYILLLFMTCLVNIQSN